MRLLTFFISIILEFIYLLVSIISGLIGFLYPFKYLVKNLSKKSTPVVIVHGWMNSNLIFTSLRKFLESKDFSVYMANFGFHAGDLDIYAEKLGQYIKNNKLKDAVLIGASAGALISFAYLQKLDGWNNVDKFISLSGPLKGTPVAYLDFLFTKAGFQMRPNSKFIKSLWQEKIKNPEKIICLRAKYDEFVPSSSSQIEGANNIIINTVGHTSLIAFSKKTLKTILKNI